MNVLLVREVALKNCFVPFLFGFLFVFSNGLTALLGVIYSRIGGSPTLYVCAAILGSLSIALDAFLGFAIYAICCFRPAAKCAPNPGTTQVVNPLYGCDEP